MDLATLDSCLTVTGGTLTLAPDAVPGTDLGPLLAEYNGGRPLVVDDAVKRPVQPSDTSVTIDGTVMLLASRLGVTAVFAIDGDAVVVTLRMPLNTTPGGWSFRHAFPAMPAFKGRWNDGTQVPQGDALDSIDLTDAALVLTNARGTDPVVDAPLVPGLNVVGRCFPLRALGLLGELVAPVARPVVAGVIHLPRPDDAVPALTGETWPWEATTAVPGIDLAIELGSTPAIPGTHVSLADVRLRLYTPTDATANPAYAPTVALTAAVTVADGVEPVTLTALVGPNLETLTLQAAFSGLSLANLAALAGVTGSADLFRALPAALRDAGDTLGGISLLGAGLTLTRTGGTVALSMVYASVGIPSLDLDIGVGRLTGLAAHFAVATPFTDPQVDVQIEGRGSIPSLGGATFDVTVDVTTGDARGTLSDATLPLGTLFADLGLPPPSDLTIDSADLEVSANGVAFNATVAEDPPWSLSLGGRTVTVSDVVLTAAKPREGAGTASIAGQLALGSDIVLALGYELPGDFRLRGTFPDASLTGLLGALGLPSALPNGFDMRFDETSVELTEQAGTLQLTAATTVENVGLLALVAREEQGTYGFAAGVDLDVASIAALPGMSALAAFESVTGLTNLMVVVSTISDPGFTFPSLSALPTPAIRDRNVTLPAQATGVAPGFVVYGSVSATSSRALQAIGRWLGVRFDGTLGAFVAVALPDPSNGSRLAFAVNGEVDGVLVAGQLGASLQGGFPTLYLTGTATTTIQGQRVVFTLSAAVAANGVVVSGGYTGTLTFTVDGHGIALSNVGLAVGLNWEGVPGLGFTAAIDTAGFGASVAVFLDSVTPAQSMFAGSLTDVSLAEVVTALAGTPLPDAIAPVLARVAVRGLAAFTLPASVATALDDRDLAAVATAFQPFAPIPSSNEQVLLVANAPGSSWHLTDLRTMTHYTLTRTDDAVAVAKRAQVYCAPVATAIGPNTFPAGFHVEASLDLLFLHLDTLRIEIAPGRGIAADIEFGPITVGGPSFFSITGAGGSGGPLLSVATFAQTPEQEPDPRRQPPHVLLSGAATFLGEVVSSIYLDVSPAGLRFAIVETFDCVRIDVAGSVTSWRDFAARGTVAIRAGGTVDLGPLGSVSVDAEASGTLMVSCTDGAAAAGVAASVDLPGLGRLQLPTLMLDVNGALSSLTDRLWPEIENAFRTAVQTPAQWLQLVSDGVISGVHGAEQIGSVLATSFNESVTEVGTLARSIAGYGADQVAEAMRSAGGAADDIANALAGFGFPDAAVSQALSIFPTHVDFTLGHVDTPSVHSDIHCDLLFSTHTDFTMFPHVDTGTHVDTR